MMKIKTPDWWLELNIKITNQMNAFLKSKPKQIDLKAFFENYRIQFGKLSQKQVDALTEFIRLTNENISELNVNQWAYAYATTYHETAQTFAPIKEYGSNKYLSKYDTGKLAKDLGNTPEADGDGIDLAGKGYVQITGRRNYEIQSKNASEYFGEEIDFVENPDLCLVPKYAFFNLWYGMKHGIYTGKKISNYLSDLVSDYVGARRVINGNDKAQVIAIYAQKFELILKDSIR